MYLPVPPAPVRLPRWRGRCWKQAVRAVVPDVRHASHARHGSKARPKPGSLHVTLVYSTASVFTSIALTSLTPSAFISPRTPPTRKSRPLPRRAPRQTCDDSLPSFPTPPNHDVSIPGPSLKMGAVSAVLLILITIFCRSLRFQTGLFALAAERPPPPTDRICSSPCRRLLRRRLRGGPLCQHLLDDPGVSCAPRCRDPGRSD